MYYFVGASLPELRIGVTPELTFDEFTQLLELNLSNPDFKKAEAIKRYYDIQNIRAFLNKEALDLYGSYNEKELEEALVSQTGFPEYVFELLHSPDLLEAYFENEIKDSSGFLREFMTFERDWRLVFMKLRSNQPVEEYPELKAIYEEGGPMQMHRALYEYRFNMINEMCGLEQFSLKKILGYMVQLILAEKWSKLDHDKGKEFMDQLIRRTS